MSISLIDKILNKISGKTSHSHNSDLLDAKIAEMQASKLPVIATLNELKEEPPEQKEWHVKNTVKKKKKNLKTPTFYEIEGEMSKFHNIDVKNKLKNFSQIINKINLFQNSEEAQIHELEQCVHFIMTHRKYDKKILSSKAISQLKFKILDKQNIREPRIVVKKTKKICTGMGGFVVGDPIFWDEYDYNNNVEFCKQGKGCFFSSAQGDGDYKVTIMLVDGNHPFPPKNVFNKTLDSSEEIFLNLQSGMIGVTGLLDIALTLTIPSGHYKMAIYCKWGVNSPEFTIVISKTDESINNENYVLFEPRC